MEETKQKPVTVKSYDGTEDVNIKNYQDSLRIHFPSYARKNIDDYGNAFLSNCCFALPTCGCEIIGCGTLQFPLTIKFCHKHQKQ